MMLKEASFASELASYRTSVVRHRDVLKRWRERGFENFWQVIHAADKQEPLTAKEFISFVLSASHPTRRVIEHNREVKREFEERKALLLRDLSWAESPIEVLRCIAESTAVFEVLRRSSYDFNTPFVSRKDQNGSRDRVAFIKRMNGFLTTRCRKPMHDVVAELVDITFKREGTSADDVKKCL
jgi:hypothetical protein